MVAGPVAWRAIPSVMARVGVADWLTRPIVQDILVTLVTLIRARKKTFFDAKARPVDTAGGKIKEALASSIDWMSPPAAPVVNNHWPPSPLPPARALELTVVPPEAAVV